MQAVLDRTSLVVVRRALHRQDGVALASAQESGLARVHSAGADDLVCNAEVDPLGPEVLVEAYGGQVEAAEVGDVLRHQVGHQCEWLVLDGPEPL